jgi:hypothetical protein
MMTPIPSPASPRRRGLAWFTATALVVGTAAALPFGGHPSALAAPAEDCAEAFPVADLEDGDPVEGFTVSKGTTPELFTGEVLGVLADGIAPGVDMVIMDLDSPAIEAAGGIWQGMSGSPVYTADGDLIGAVAYGLSWGPSPIAGITPFEHMDDYLGAMPARRATVDRATARRIAATGEASRSQAEQGFEMLGVATGVSGVRSARLSQLRDQGRSYIPKSAGTAGRASLDDSTSADDVYAGGNLAASYSYGDINFAGVGTATSVCDGQVVGFGHPFSFSGATTMSLHPADAIYVQPESIGAPFKVANLGNPVGTIFQDHLTGITGEFGALPAGTQITSSVSFGSRNRTGSTTVTVPELAAAVTFFQLIANHDRVLDAITEGSELQSWTITGDVDGVPFSISHTDRYTSQFDLSFEASIELADLVYLLSTLDGLTIDDISVDSSATRAAGSYRVVGNQVKVRGAWMNVSHRNPLRTKAGKLLRLRAVLKSSNGGKITSPYSFRVPQEAAGMRGQIFLTGGAEYYGGDYYYEEGPGTFAEIEELIDGLVRNDTVLADLMFGGGRPFGEEDGYVVAACKGCRGDTVDLNSSTTLPPVDQVVVGFKRIKVRVQ